MSSAHPVGCTFRRWYYRWGHQVLALSSPRGGNRRIHRLFLVGYPGTVHVPHLVDTAGTLARLAVAQDGVSHAAVRRLEGSQPGATVANRAYLLLAVRMI